MFGSMLLVVACSLGLRRALKGQRWVGVLLFTPAVGTTETGELGGGHGIVGYRHGKCIHNPYEHIHVTYPFNCISYQVLNTSKMTIQLSAVVLLAMMIYMGHSSIHLHILTNKIWWREKDFRSTQLSDQLCSIYSSFIFPAPHLKYLTDCPQNCISFHLTDFIVDFYHLYITHWS